jgi:uncharacterized UPF0146 family protein
MISQEVATKMTGQTAARDLAEFIARYYPGRVVEVGVGYFPHVAQRLSEMGLEVILTDREERLLAGMRVKKDEIFAPQRDIYQGAGLIYSIRPPLEMQLAMGELAAAVAADVIVRPLQDEIAQLAGFSRRLVNYEEARFYLFRKKE